MTILIATPSGPAVDADIRSSDSCPASKTKLYAQRIQDLYLDFYLWLVMRRSDNVTVVSASFDESSHERFFVTVRANAARRSISSPVLIAFRSQRPTAPIASNGGVPRTFLFVEPI